LASIYTIGHTLVDIRSLEEARSCAGFPGWVQCASLCCSGECSWKSPKKAIGLLHRVQDFVIW